MNMEFKHRVRPYIVQLKELLVSFLGVRFFQLQLCGVFLTKFLHSWRFHSLFLAAVFSQAHMQHEQKVIENKMELIITAFPT